MASAESRRRSAHLRVRLRMRASGRPCVFATAHPCICSSVSLRAHARVRESDLGAPDSSTDAGARTAASRRAAVGALACMRAVVHASGSSLVVVVVVIRRRRRSPCSSRSPSVVVRLVRRRSSFVDLLVVLVGRCPWPPVAERCPECVIHRNLRFRCNPQVAVTGCRRWSSSSPSPSPSPSSVIATRRRPSSRLSSLVVVFVDVVVRRRCPSSIPSPPPSSVLHPRSGVRRPLSCRRC